MARDINLLDSIQIATPCSASWSAMKGDDRVRFCDQCSLHVYNFAELNHVEAEKLITESEGRLCVRLYRRHDGTVITRDCPVALARVRRKLAAGLTCLGTFLIASIGTVFAVAGRPQIDMRLRNCEPFSRLCKWLNPVTPPAAGKILMGDARVVPNPRKKNYTETSPDLNANRSS